MNKRTTEFLKELSAEETRRERAFFEEIETMRKLDKPQEVSLVRMLKERM